MTVEQQRAVLRVTLDALLVLDAIDRAGSFAGGAEELRRVPSAVSHTVQKIEQDLGIAIFDRTGYRAKLTAAGRELLREGRELLRAAQQMERRVREIGSAREASLTIGVSDLVSRSGLYSLLSLLFDAPDHPPTQVCITREAQAGAQQNLLAGRSDIVIGGVERPCVDGVRARVLGEVEVALVMPQAHPLARVSEPLSRQALLPYRMIRPQESLFEDLLEYDWSGSVVVDDYASQVEAIRHGLGIGLVPYHLVRDEGDTGRLITKVVHDVPRLRLTVAWRAGDSSDSLQWMLDHVLEERVIARLIPRRKQSPDFADLPISDATQQRGSEVVLREHWLHREQDAQSPGRRSL